MRARIGTALAVLLLAGVAAGCGGGPKDPAKSQASTPKSFKMRASGTPEAVKITAPGEFPAGLTRFDFTNDAQGKHSVQVIRVDGGRKPAAALKATFAWFQGGKPLPKWVYLAGGVPLTESGDRRSAVQELAPGDYFIVDPEKKGKPEVAAQFRVTAGSPAKLQGSPARIEAYEYGFRATGLTAGENRVLFDNKGKEPHFVEAAPLKPGKTLADVKRFLKNEKGEPPLIFNAAVSTPVLDAKGKQQVDLHFTRKGKFALLCFVPDRKGGPPHAAKGMVSIAEVK